jgi:hypothetical protein
VAKKRTLPAAMKKTQFKKGKSGNPQGGKLHDPAKRILRTLTIETYREVIELVLTNNVQAIKEMVADPNVSALQVGIATAFLKAIANGDYTVIERIAERIVGKIPDELHVKSDNRNVNANLNASIDKAKLRAAYDELEKEV